jgi:hypothetical protein
MKKVFTLHFLLFFAVLGTNSYCLETPTKKANPSEETTIDKQSETESFAKAFYALNCDAIKKLLLNNKNIPTLFVQSSEIHPISNINRLTSNSNFINFLHVFLTIIHQCPNFLTTTAKDKLNCLQALNNRRDKYIKSIEDEYNNAKSPADVLAFVAPDSGILERFEILINIAEALSA